ncbi:allB_3 [Blepharisma stoltei]|uniref:Amidohydrolase-related domain-containing protein n=1 Tax=Blepharisma stoltei TaxID=1481888 RepID=A0AAU9JBK0_9CILI|nr:unnamed protein product [Blepharisma stoltei]
MSSKFALISKNIISSDFQLPIHGAIIIEDGLILDIMPYSKSIENYLQQTCIVEDLGELFISPGIIDLNVSFGYDGQLITTKSALSGGVTCIASCEKIIEDIYTDIAPLVYLSDENLQDLPNLISSGIFGFKAVMVPQNYNFPIINSHIEEALKIIGNSLPIFVHPEFFTVKSLMEIAPHRCIIPEEFPSTPSDCKIGEHPDTEERFSSEDEILPFSYSPNSTPTTKDIGGIRRTSFKIPTIIHPFEMSPPKSPDKKRGSLPCVLSVIEEKNKNEEQEEHKKSPKISERHSILCTVEGYSKPMPIQDLKCIKKEANFDYNLQHVESFPVEWEIEAVNRILNHATMEAKIHFLNVSSSTAIELIKSNKTSYSHLTCETSTPYLYFDTSSIKQRDGRYKVNPPIRDAKNNSLLWNLLMSQTIDSLSSYHQQFPPLQKLGEFNEASNGISSIGYLLPAVWTKLKRIVPAEFEKEALVKLSNWLSNNPANILGINRKGCIRRGKHADLVVWDPYEKFTVEKSENSLDVSPFVGEELYGVVLRTYARGKLAFSKCTKLSFPIGKVLKKD